jgi:hypothetical protein
VAGEVFELTDEVTLLALSVDLRFVEAGAEVVVAGFGVGQQVPDDGEHRVADCDDGSFLARRRIRRR